MKPKVLAALVPLAYVALAACTAVPEAGPPEPAGLVVVLPDVPPTERAVRVEHVVSAPIERVWSLWTTSAGVESFWAPEAIVDARPGGAYRVHFLPDGEPGSKGNDWGVVLGVDPPRRLVTTWYQPPYMPEVRNEATRLDVLLEPAEANRTRVRIVHSGWGSGRAWDEAFAYFDTVWPNVLTGLEAHVVGAELP